jgi:hypothetical protein
MTNLEDIDRTISMLRTQATQLNLLADHMESMIQPWKMAQEIMNANQQWVQMWTQSLGLLRSKDT